MVRQKKRRRREGTDTDQGEVKALRQENEELKLRIAKLEARCHTPQEEDKEKEVKLPTEVWAIIVWKIDKNDVCSFALVSKQLRQAQVLAGRKLVTKLTWRSGSTADYFTEDWCAYWSRKFNVHHTNHKTVKRVLYVAARHGYLQMFEKYWSQGPQEKLSKLWDEYTCGFAAFGGHLEVLQWLRAKDCPWDSYVCDNAAKNGHLEVLRWSRSQGCHWDGIAPRAAARNGHLEVLRLLIKAGCPYSKDKCREAAAEGGEQAREVLEWLDE